MDDEIKAKVAEDARKYELRDLQVFCYPCRHQNKPTEATRFCKACDDEQPLCENCAQSHTRTKAIQGHQMHACDDLDQLPNYRMLRSLNQDKGESEKHKKQTLCDSCLWVKKWSKAVMFCKCCKPLILLCKDCEQQHRGKEAEKHEMCDDLGQFWTFQRMSNPEEIKQSKKHHVQEVTKLTKNSDLPNYFQRSCSLSSRVPGKPQATEVKSDSVSLVWERPSEKMDNFQIRYKLESRDSKWKFFESSLNENCATVKGLMADMEYRFQVRGLYNDEEGPYGLISDIIKTRMSLATKMLESCEPPFENTSPPKYLLPVKENIKSRNTDARTRQLTLGNPVKGYRDEKTIMLVGATGSGKSTLVDGIANYIMGVSFEDPFRFKMVTLEDNEKKDNQAHSQTEWITVYRIYPTDGSRLNYTLKIIDTPGFGDTRGIERDHDIVDQIRHLFSAKGEQGVLYIDAVCFIAKAPDARLTPVQKYIFNSIMSLFGKDIASNICTLITFADGGDPPVLASLKESKLPFGKTFHFNNSALFAENKTGNTLSPMFWEMGSKSFKTFFEHISKLETKSLRQTKDVLDERERMKTIISNLQPNVTAGLSKISELQEQLQNFEKNKNIIKENKNFEYTVNETKQIMVDLPVGQHVTNCLQCNYTCHENCMIADDDRKVHCLAMDTSGECKICPAKCHWKMHKNAKYIIKYATEPVKKTYANMKEKLEEAMGQTLTHEKCIEQLSIEIDELELEITEMVNEMNECRARLSEIALSPDPLSSAE